MSEETPPVDVTPTPAPEAATPVQTPPAQAAPAPEASQPSPTPMAPAMPGTGPATLGINGPMPEELRTFSWPALLLSWIWAFNHKLTNQGLISLALSFVNPLGFFYAIYMGIHGNEWAWNARRFESVTEFKKVQKIWTIWGIVILAIPIAFGLLFFMALMASSGTSSY